MKKELVAVLLACWLAACAQPPARQQQVAPAPPAPAAPPPEAVAPPAPRVTSEAQIAPGRWDVDRVRCSDLLGAADDDRAAAAMFYYGYLAAKAGIHVIGYDAESQPDAREWFAQMCTPEGVAKADIDSLVKEIGPEADFAIVTSSLTAAGQNAWIAEIKKYIASAYPKLNLVTILPAEEDQQKAFQVTGQILKAYPNVKGIIGLSSVAFPGAADAITQANLIGKIAVVGQSTPNQMKPFIKSGAVKSDVLWNPVDLGYAAAYAMRAVIDGKLKPGDTELDAGKLGKLKIINGSQILLGPPTVFTKDNIDKYDF